ncbi:hypothetical protein Cgig2_023081 [Carnegiea gigantea]|uniref:Uncharacterized protein n=1 Tax=Carnegiea gigantea TaxID=171969 RepID=A0A9Q1Q8R2_9CARY|nr:hypothetical protein Cgig2_023081 [Carnegiea gigantea]
MLQCLSLKSSKSSSTAASHPRCMQGEGNASEGTPRTPGTSPAPSPTVNLSREYTLAVQTNSYSEIWTKIHVVEQWDSTEPNYEQKLLLSEILQPNRALVEEVLRNVRPSTFTQLVSTYFEHSEKTCHLLLLLHHCIHHARSIYAPIHDLVDDLPPDMTSMTQFRCNHAFDVFLNFDKAGNPFPCPDSHNFHEMRLCFSQLKEEVDLQLKKSRGRLNVVRRATTGSAICLIGTVVAVAAAAVAVTVHALVALAAVSIAPSFLPSDFTKREIVHLAQLDAAAKSAYVLHNDLDTIDRLVARLHTAIDGDKLLIRLGLDRGRDKHPIYEVMKQLGKNRVNFLEQLTDLEEHICLCLIAINRARSLLMNEISHKTDS